MGIAKRRLAWFLGALLMVLGTSCVESRHPLSDESTSTVDERLIGVWRIDYDRGLWKITKSTSTKNALELELKGPDGPAHARLFATTINGKSYLSLQDLGEDARKTYEIYQYRFLDDGCIEVRGMVSEAIIKAIADKRLDGRIKKSKTPIITGKAGQLTRYLETHADECFPEKPRLVVHFRRQG